MRPDNGNDTRETTTAETPIAAAAEAELPGSPRIPRTPAEAATSPTPAASEPEADAEIPSEVVSVGRRPADRPGSGPAWTGDHATDDDGVDAEAPLDPRDVTFPTAWRGYDQGAVDAHIRKMARTIEELEAMRTPQEVVRRALDRVGEQTSAILREAEEAAERTTSKSRADADERVQRAEREADTITRRARTRLQDLDLDIDRIWLERQRLIEDTRKLADALLEMADDAEERFPAEEEAPPQPPPLSASAGADSPSRDAAASGAPDAHLKGAHAAGRDSQDLAAPAPAPASSRGEQTLQGGPPDAGSAA